MVARRWISVGLTLAASALAVVLIVVRLPHRDDAAQNRPRAPEQAHQAPSEIAGSREASSGIVVTGVVAAGAVPLPDVFITAQVGDETENAVTSSDGRFSLRLRRRGLLSFRLRGLEIVRGASMELVDNIHDVVIEVGATSAISGRVFLEGRAVAGATVSLGYPRRTTTTDHTGTYRIALLPAGKYALEAIDQSGDAKSADRDVEIGVAEERTGVDLQLELRASVSGRVVDATGTPMRRVRVGMAPRGGGVRGGSDVTGMDGQYRVRHLVAGEYTPRVWPAGQNDVPYRAADNKHFAKVLVKGDDAQVAGIELVVDARLAPIDGRLVDQRGAAVSGATVTITHSELIGENVAVLRTIADGTFSTVPLPVDRYSFMAKTVDGRTTVASDVDVGAGNVLLTLPRTMLVQGALVGFPPKTEVRARQGMLSVAVQVQGDRFVVRDAPVGELELTAAGGGLFDAQLVRIAPGELASLTLTARPTTRITGRVVLQDASALVTTRCSWEAGLGDRIGPQRLVVDTSGGFTLDAPIGLGLTIECGATTSDRVFAGQAIVDEVHLADNTAIEVVLRSHPRAL